MPINHPALLKAENERLIEVLELARSHIVELCTVMNIPLPDATIRRIDSALSQQAEPTDTYTAVDMATANPEAIQKLLAERDAFLEARTSLIEENDHLYDEIADLRHALTLCVASLDQLLPYLAKVPADVGLLNDALMAARPLLEKRP